MAALQAALEFIGTPPPPVASARTGKSCCCPSPPPPRFLPPTPSPPSSVPFFPPPLPLPLPLLSHPISPLLCSFCPTHSSPLLPFLPASSFFSCSPCSICLYSTDCHVSTAAALIPRSCTHSHYSPSCPVLSRLDMMNATWAFTYCSSVHIKPNMLTVAHDIKYADCAT